MMDYIIAGALLIVALCIVFGKPIQITIMHKYENPPLPEQTPEDEIAKLKTENEEQSETLRSMDAVIQSLHELMGVNTDDNKPV
jgi:hypothetical protein